MFVYKGFLIEHRFSKPRVRGSNPLGRANNLSIINISVNLSPHCPVIVLFDPSKSYNSTRLTHKEIECRIRVKWKNILVVVRVAKLDTILLVNQ